jgi:flagellar protein FliL
MAEQAKAPDAPPTEGTKNNKKIIIIAAAIVAVAILGAAAMFFLGGKSDKKTAQEPAKVEAKSESGHGEGKGEAKGGEAVAVSTYPLEPFIVNIYDGQEIRYLKMKVEFELANSGAKTELDAKVPPLRDAILILLTTKTMQEIQDLQGKNQLREQILGAVNKIVTAGKVTKVYFTDFVVQ